MRIIKFRYVYQHQETGRITSECYMLIEIEREHLQRSALFLIDHWEIIARDQFTGLTDKHGQEIYEGDIIHNPMAGSFLIEFKNGSFGYKSPPGFAILYLFPTSDCEVIGNVHENPELL